MENNSELFPYEQERPQPEYAAMAPTMERNPITGLKEPYFPEKQRIPRIITGVAVIIVMVTSIIYFLVHFDYLCCVCVNQVAVTVELFC